MVNSITYVGIDIAKLTFDACISPSKTSRTFPNTTKGFKQFLKWTKSKQPELLNVTMEATGRYHMNLANTLHERGCHVFVLNPRRFKHYAKSQPRRGQHNPYLRDAQQKVLLFLQLSILFDDLLDFLVDQFNLLSQKIVQALIAWRQ